MKQIFKPAALLALIPLACLCNKPELVVNPGDTVTIEAAIPETKVSINPGTEATDPALVLAFEQTDQIVVDGTTQSIFTVSQIVNAHQASFTGTAVEGATFDIYYPDKDILTRSYEGQVQEGNASTAHLKFNAMAAGLDSYGPFTFSKVNGAVKLAVKVPSGVTAVDSIAIISQDASGVEQNVFYKTNDAEGDKTSAIGLKFKDTAPASGVVTAYAMVSWNEVALAKDSRIAVKLFTPGKTCSYEKTIKLSNDYTVAGGQTFILDLSSATALQHKLAGKGTKDDPYLLCDTEDLLLMNGLLVADQTKYFKLQADVDMKGIDWSPSNQSADSYKLGINFDGDNHTISNLTVNKTNLYCGFVGVLNGTIANVNFDKANITGTIASGVVCGYAGTSGTAAPTIKNVNITNSSVTMNGEKPVGIVAGIIALDGGKFETINAQGTVTQSKNSPSGFMFGQTKNGISASFIGCHGNGTLKLTATSIGKTAAATGGIIGQSSKCSFSKCSFTGTINGGRLCGGIVGYDNTSGASMDQCWTNATITVKQYTNVEAPTKNISGENVGGLAGYFEGGTISNCYTSGTITLPDQVGGGLVGEVGNGVTTVTNCWSKATINAGRVAGGIAGRACKGNWTTTNAKNLDLSKCVSFATISVPKASNANGSSGAFVGYTSLNNVLANCWRKDPFSFTTGANNNFAADQPDGCSGWVKGSTTQVGTGTSPTQYLFPYWGKASDQSTVSATVTGKSLGWSADIWDLTTDFPTLKNNPEPAQ